MNQWFIKTGRVRSNASYLTLMTKLNSLSTHLLTSTNRLTSLLCLQDTTLNETNAPYNLKLQFNFSLPTSFSYFDSRTPFPCIAIKLQSALHVRYLSSYTRACEPNTSEFHQLWWSIIWSQVYQSLRAPGNLTARGPRDSSRPRCTSARVHYGV